MNPGTLSPELRSAAPALAVRLGAILLGLATLIAAAYLRNPARVGIIVPLWNRLTRTARRFERLMARLALGRERPRPSRSGSPRGDATKPAGARPQFPADRGWILADLKHQAAHFTNRLDYLLSDPAAAAILAHCPQALRMLRPLCHMMGVRNPLGAPLPRHRKRPPAPAATVQPAAVGGETEPPPIAPAPPHDAATRPDTPWPWLPWQAAPAI